MSEYLPEILVRYGDDLLDGFVVTIQLVVYSVVLGAILGTGLTYLRMKGGRITGPLTWLYTNLFRGTPLLAQLFLIYYGAGQFSGFWRAIGVWNFLRDPFNCAVLAFTLNTAAYQSEIFRGAVRAVPVGQWEGAMALGLDRLQTFRKVILPQASLYALRPFGNEVILMIKGSAVASIVTVYDLLGETRLAYSQSFRFEVYFYAAALYLILVETLRQVWNLAERRLTRHLKTANTASRPADTTGPAEPPVMSAT
ncbi:Nopaline transport system permease protein NocM [Stappia sp. 22II-S9-Z10]|nr:Nopaline transport system permease protein NocM [Stappia sp. 22II-S9-Z10]